MSAVIRIAGDIGPELERYVYVPWRVGKHEIEVAYRIRYRIDYATLRDRGFGRNPELVILAIDQQFGGMWKPARLDAQQWAALRGEIETEEELCAPMEGL